MEPTTSAQGYYATEGATIRIEPSGKVNVYVAGGSTGNSLETTVVQLTADALGVELDDVATIQGDTAVTPFGAGTGGSRSGSMIAGAVAETAGILREKLVALAAHRLEAAEEDIELVGSQAFVRGAPAAGVGVAELAGLAYFQPHKLPPGMGAGLEASARYAAKSPMIWANATHVCTCEVDVVTGAVELLRYIVSRGLRPDDQPQRRGGADRGRHGAGDRRCAHGAPRVRRRRQPAVDHVRRLPAADATEVPTIEYGHVETPSPGPGGYKGVGEGGAIGATPAVVNAVADALAPFGVDVTRLPVTPAAVVGLLEDAAARG